MSAIVEDVDGQRPAQPEPTWYDESLERYMNPRAFARKNAPEPTPALQEEISLVCPSGGKNVKLEVRAPHADCYKRCSRCACSQS